jgi:capsular polysaccharide transport system permease protein
MSMHDIPSRSRRTDWLKPSNGTLKTLNQEREAWRRDALGFASKMRTVLRVLEALVLREIMTRFGREHLGFLWLILEPLILTTMVMVGWTLMYGTSKHGVTVVHLVLSGYSMLTLWRHIIFRFMHCFKHNAGLMFHRNVKPMDTILARFFLETTGTLISFFVSYLALYILNLIGPIHDFLLLLSGWYLLAAFAFAVAVSVSALSELWEPSEKFVQPLMYITIPLTGAFFMVSWMPADYHDALLLSPMVNTVEMFRAGLIGPSVQTYYHADYVIYVTLFLTAIGFLLMRKAEAHIKIE